MSVEEGQWHKQIEGANMLGSSVISLYKNMAFHSYLSTSFLFRLTL